MFCHEEIEAHGRANHLRSAASGDEHDCCRGLPEDGHYRSYLLQLRWTVCFKVAVIKTAQRRELATEEAIGRSDPRQTNAPRSCSKTSPETRGRSALATSLPRERATQLRD